MTNYLSANRNRAPLIVACVVAHLGILGCSATCKTATQRRTCASADDTHGLVVFRELREGHIEALKLRRVVLMQPVAMNSHTTRLDCDSTFFRLPTDPRALGYWIALVGDVAGTDCESFEVARSQALTATTQQTDAIWQLPRVHSERLRGRWAIMDRTTDTWQQCESTKALLAAVLHPYDWGGYGAREALAPLCRSSVGWREGSPAYVLNVTNNNRIELLQLDGFVLLKQIGCEQDINPVHCANLAPVAAVGHAALWTFNGVDDAVDAVNGEAVQFHAALTAWPIPADPSPSFLIYYPDQYDAISEWLNNQEE